MIGKWFRRLAGGLIVVVTLVLILGVLATRREREREVSQGDPTIDDVLNMVQSNSGLEMRSRGITVVRCTRRIQNVKNGSDMLIGCRVSGSAAQLNGWIASRAFSRGPSVVHRLPPAMDLIDVGGPFPVHELYGDVSPEDSFSVGTVVVVDASHTHAIVYDRTRLVPGGT
jgi:hypothetical protein